MTSLLSICLSLSCC